MRLIIVLLLLIADLDSLAEQNTIIGEMTRHIVGEDETFYDIARLYDLGINELIYANDGIDPWLPGVGTRVIIPAMHILPNLDSLSKRKSGAKAKDATINSVHVNGESVIINRAELRLYYFYKLNGLRYILTFPVSMGEEGHETPLGEAYITNKQRHPSWYPPKSIRLERPELPISVPPSAENPLGDFAIFLSWPGILIHSTNKPWSIGTYSTHGCIRMYAEDIAVLFELVKANVMVQIIDQPIKLGWKNNKLYIQASPSKEQRDFFDLYKKKTPLVNLNEIKASIISHYFDIDELVLDEALRNFQAIPVNINR